jgi:hypothetical protein
MAKIVRRVWTSRGALGELTILALGCLLIVGADWSSCQDNLDKLGRRARDAAEKATQVANASDDVERKRREFEDCRMLPAVYDLFRNGCAYQADEYRSARGQFESAKGYLESGLDDVDSAIGSVSDSCGFTFSVGTASGDPFCRIIQRFKGRMPRESLMDSCRKSGRTAEQCAACLQ